MYYSVRMLHSVRMLQPDEQADFNRVESVDIVTYYQYHELHTCQYGILNSRVLKDANENNCLRAT